IRVHHYPPGTSKWNKIEHRLFCHITQNWRGRPLTDRLAVVELIAATTTKTGLTVRCELDNNLYEKGIKVGDAEMATLNIEGDAFHPEWNYTIRPRRREAPSWSTCFAASPYIVYAPLLHGCTSVLYEGKPIGTPDAGAFWRVIE